MKYCKYALYFFAASFVCLLVSYGIVLYGDLWAESETKDTKNYNVKFSCVNAACVGTNDVACVSISCGRMGE